MDRELNCPRLCSSSFMAFLPPLGVADGIDPPENMVYLHTAWRYKELMFTSVLIFCSLLCARPFVPAARMGWLVSLFILPELLARYLYPAKYVTRGGTGTSTVNSWEGIRFLLTACGGLFIGAQVMFEYREEEMRNGIFRRC
ncbi:hypothetical protein A0H81_07409 [Grifola frondosa]|uniref:Uncharacterized protein n=1 Tax=Grifola frondosa TaxID=5627 RepID=A0A1C7MB48_GRIFR|nr:hypothetical protein A0H81_07409 [Grifola frondosa]